MDARAGVAAAPVPSSPSADAALRLHARLLESMSEGVSLSNEAGIIVYTNPAEDQMFGYGPGELLGQHVSVQNAYPPEENARRVADVIAELQAGRSWEGDWLNVRKDGSTFVTRARITALELDGQNHWVCVQYDVTDQAHAAASRQEALAAVENARREIDAARAVASTLIDSVRDPFVAYDSEFRFTFVNAAASEMFASAGANPSPLGSTLWEAFPHVIGTPVEAAMRRAMTERVPAHFDAENPVLRRWYAARVYPAADGGLTAVFADVTAEQRARERADFLADAGRVLSASLDYATTLAALAESAVPRLGDWCAVDIVRDPDARRWPPTVERLAVIHQDPAMLALGRELMEQYPTDWSAPDGMAPVLRDGTIFFVPEVTDAMLAAGAHDARHLELLTAFRFTSVMIVPLVARGLTLGALTLCMTESGRRHDEADRDLALEIAQRAAIAVDNARLFRDAEQARADAEHERQEAVRQRSAAEAANAAKGQFLSIMSHELRTPLNAIGGYADLLALGLRGPVTAEQQQDLERIQFANRHMMSLVTDILNFARLDAGQLEYRLEVIGIADLVAELEPLIGPQLAGKGIAFDIDACAPVAPAEPYRVRADRERLRQILLNLLSNAVKFTERGGRVTLSCQVDTPAGTIRLSVTDTGLGIPEDFRDRIFEPFVQVDRNRIPESQQGVGLGLAISRELARRMAGDLTLDRTSPSGSTFSLVLPHG